MISSRTPCKEHLFGGLRNPAYKKKVAQQE
jgi:hypothetical protein